MILSRDDYFKRINEIVGERTDEESIKFIEDMSDTYSDMEHHITDSGEDWEKKYHELDKAWREKYKNRFFTGTSRVITGETETGERKEKTDFSDLFE